MIAGKVLAIVVKGMEAWEKGRNLDEILDDLSKGENREYRSKVSAILFTYFRNKAYIDHVIDFLVKKKIESAVKKVISVALVQIFFQDGVAKEVAVDVAVDYARKIRNKRTAGFVNAILRNAIRGAFNDAKQNAPEYVKNSIPKLLFDRWKKAFSVEEIEAIVASIRKQAPFTFRVLRDIDKFKPEENSSTPLKNLSWLNKFNFYKTDRPDLILKSDFMDSGMIYVQDPATAMAPSFIDANAPVKILDVCSAPGGKTLMLAELYPNAEVIAMDRSPKRLERVTENITRTKTKKITTIVGDALKPPFDMNSFDVVFVDAPCSNTGVIRHRPDVMWRFSQKHLDEILNLQMDILQSVSELVKPGGKLVYSTCSIEHAEDRKQVDKFLDKNDDFVFEKDSLLMPSEDNDGAYAAVLNRKEENNF